MYIGSNGVNSSNMSGTGVNGGNDPYRIMNQLHGGFNNSQTNEESHQTHHDASVSNNHNQSTDSTNASSSNKNDQSQSIRQETDHVMTPHSMDQSGEGTEGAADSDDPSGGNRSGSGSQRSRKRGRVDVACVQCRSRKTRCDGQQPVCGRCTQRGLPCEFVKKFTRARVSAEYVKGLEHKLAQLENGAITGNNSNVADTAVSQQLSPPQPQPPPPPASAPSSNVDPASSSRNAHINTHVTRNRQVSFIDSTHAHHRTDKPQTHATLVHSTVTDHIYNHNSQTNPHDVVQTSHAHPAESPIPIIRHLQHTNEPTLNESAGARTTTATAAPTTATATATTTTTTAAPGTGPGSSTDEAEEEPVAADAMGAAMASRESKNKEQRQDFYGSSSALSFMKLVEAAVNAGKEQHDGSPSSTTSSHTALSPFNNILQANANLHNRTLGSTGSSGFSPSPSAMSSVHSAGDTGHPHYGENGGTTQTHIRRNFAVKTRCSMSSGKPRRKYSMLSSSSSFSHGKSGFNKSLREEDWAIPPRRTADHYVQCYFTYVYSLYPFLHQPSFMKAYRAMWEPELESHGDNSGDPDHHRKRQKRSGRDSAGSDRSSSSSSRGMPDHMFYCILNIVFAFGCLFSSSLESPSKATASLVYFDRARDHLNANFNLLDTGDSGSLILLQALLLIGQYLQATEKPAACWNVVGLAIRVAQELGLHREYQICSRPSRIEQEICRRLWHGCILMDRMVSMTFGRPLMVTQNVKVRLPLFVDDEFITDDGIEPESDQKPSILAFYKQTLILYDILAEILKTFYDAHGTTGTGFIDYDAADYGPNSYSSTTSPNPSDNFGVEWLKKIIDIDNRLAQWKANIPLHLRKEPASMSVTQDASPINSQTTFGIGSINTSAAGRRRTSHGRRSFSTSAYETAATQEPNPSEYSPFLRQTNVLEARYLHVQIMLYRPILLPHAGNINIHDGEGKASSTSGGGEIEQKGELRRSMEITVCRMCVSAAVKLIALIYNNKTTPNIPAMWYCMFYVYTSATVLLAAKLQPALDNELDAEEMAEAWKMALALLRLFERQHGNASATRCLRVLEVLHEQIFRAGDRRGVHTLGESSSAATPGVNTPTSTISANEPGMGSKSDAKAGSKFEYLPDLVEPMPEFLDQRDTNLLFTMINDQTGPFDDHTFEYSYTDMAALNF